MQVKNRYSSVVFKMFAFISFAKKIHCTVWLMIIILLYCDCFEGQVHVTDYSNASSTGMFDPFVVSSTN